MITKKFKRNLRILRKTKNKRSRRKTKNKKNRRKTKNNRRKSRRLRGGAANKLFKLLGGGGITSKTVKNDEDLKIKFNTWFTEATEKVKEGCKRRAMILLSELNTGEYTIDNGIILNLKSDDAAGAKPADAKPAGPPPPTNVGTPNAAAASATPRRFGTVDEAAAAAAGQDQFDDAEDDVGEAGVGRRRTKATRSVVV